MDYERIYRQLIEKARSIKFDGYTETHHIIPRCLHGSDDPSNLVELTPEEHYVAHQLLVRIYPNSPPLIRAAMMMTRGRSSNKIYGWLRRRFAIIQRDSTIGINNPQYGLKWIHHPGLQQVKRVTKDDKLEDGWVYGRVVDWDKYQIRTETQQKKKHDSKRKRCLKRIRSKHHKIKNSVSYRKAKAHKMYKEFIISGLSLREFAKSKNLVAMTLSNWFNDFIQEYDIVPRKRANKQLGDAPASGL
jgi:hypothetical protein